MLSRPSPRALSVLAATALAAALAGCGGGQASAPTPAAAPVKPAGFDAASFGDPARGANPYLPQSASG